MARKTQIGTIKSVAHELGLDDELKHLPASAHYLPVFETNAKIRKGYMRWNNATGQPIDVSLSAGLEGEWRKQTFIHELAHVLDVYYRGTSDHGPAWRACADRLGYDWSYFQVESPRMAAEKAAAERPVSKCLGCGHVWMGLRRSPRARKPVGTYRHTGSCGGDVKFF